MNRRNALRRRARRPRNETEKAANREATNAHYHRTKHDPARYILKVVKARAKQKNMDFDLTLEYLAELIAPRRCAITGLELRWNPTKLRDPSSISLDRIDSSKGYVQGNVQIVSLIYNMAKQDWTKDQVLELLVMPLALRGRNTDG